MQRVVDLDAVQPWQVQVEQDQVWAPHADHVQPMDAIIRDMKRVCPRADRDLDQARKVAVIFDADDNLLLDL